MTTVLCGDSWCCGVWNQNSSGIDHPGLSQLLVEHGVDTINLGIPGGSNRNIVWRVNQFIDQNPHIKIDKLIIFQTECLRIFEDSEVLHTLNNYEEIESFYLTEFYCRLSDISQKINAPIYLIGGAGDTLWHDQFSIHHPGVNVVCQSFTNLLIHNNPRIDNPVTSYNMTKTVLKIIAKNKQKLLDVTRTMDDRIQLYRNNPHFFFPDGRHPNLSGHKKLFDLLLEKKVI
jgi:hypothetical protein